MKKEIIVIAGANGSGKTTFASLYSKKLNLPFVNADEIAKTLDIAHEAKRNLEAGELFFTQIEQLLEQNRSFIIESTMSGKYLTKLLTKIKSLDYSLVIIYLFLESVELCLERIKERVQKGGHFVPDEDVKRRYFRSKSNFWNTYRYFASHWYMIHNSKQIFDRVAMGTDEKYVVKNNEMFQSFLKDVIIRT